MTTDNASPAPGFKNPHRGGGTEVSALLGSFCGRSIPYYAGVFDKLENSPSKPTFNLAAFFFGPLWAAARGLWLFFWILAILDLVVLIATGRAWTAAAPAGVAAAIPFLVLLLHFVFARFANRIYMRRFARWKVEETTPSGFSYRSIVLAMLLILFAYPVMFGRFVIGGVEILDTFPADMNLQRNIAASIDSAVAWLVLEFEYFFDMVTYVIRSILDFLDLIFVGTPWMVSGPLVVIIAWRAAGVGTAIFTFCALGYIALFGYWEQAMSTFSQVAASFSICVAIGIPLGIWCSKNRTLYSAVRPVLDVMQTMPAFVYLIPAVAFFSIGKPPGVLATVIFAMPPIIRLTALGISQVAPSVKEAALAFGATPAQLLFKVELPLALPSIMTGVNQTIMMSLSMVVISALIGAGGLGHEIVFALNHVESGAGILAGIAVALCAMVLDRIIQGSRIARKND